MKPALEAISCWDGTLSVRAFRRAESRFDWNWHYHPEMELTLITRGAGKRLVGDCHSDYRAGDLVLLGANLPHTWASGSAGRSPTTNEAIVIQFLAGAYPEAMLALPEFGPVRSLLMRASRGLKFPPRAARLLGARLRELTERRGLDAWMALTAVLAELAKHEGQPLASSSYRHRRSFKMGSRLGRVLEQIEAHCHGPLALADAARFAGLTPASFARYFRKMTGKTYVEYRNACRVRGVCQMLAETDRSVTEIALANGFQNLANFNRCFRRIVGMAPRLYRRLWSGPAG